MIADIVAVKEQSEWVNHADAKPGERRGKRHFRDCSTACIAFISNRMVPNPGMLEAECAACTLPIGPCEEAKMVMEMATVPDAAMDYAGMPYWMVRGIGFYRVLNRGGF